MKKVLRAACGAALTVGGLIPVGLSSAGADPASAATASAFGTSIDLAGQDVIPPTGTATITLPPGGEDTDQLLLVPAQPVAVSGTATATATATTASNIPTSLKQVAQTVPGPYNARAIGLVEGLDVLTTVAGVANTSLVSASAVRAEAVGVCRGGVARYSANSEILDLNIGGTALPLNAPLQDLIDAVDNLIDPLAMVVDIQRNQVLVNADGASVIALRVTVLGALQGVPVAGQEPVLDLIAGAAQVSGLRCAPVAQCSDTQDNDNDGKIDAQDPGCLNAQGVYDPNDNDETDPLPKTAAVPTGNTTELPRTGGDSTAPLAGGLAVLALSALALRRRSLAGR